MPCFVCANPTDTAFDCTFWAKPEHPLKITLETCSKECLNDLSHPNQKDRLFKALRLLDDFRDVDLSGYQGDGKTKLIFDNSTRSLKMDMKNFRGKPLYFLETHGPDVFRFQPELAALVEKEKLKVVVETGMQMGVSTLFILDALDTNDNGGVLHTCDPYVLHIFDPRLDTAPTHPRWTLHREHSHFAMPKIFAEVGPFDLFLHDSDHGVWTQTFEYELAFRMLKPGGYLFSDDFTWGEHHAWPRFLTRNDLHTAGNFNSAAYTRKPEDRPVVTDVDAAVREATELADYAVVKYAEQLAANGQTVPDRFDPYGALGIKPATHVYISPGESTDIAAAAAEAPKPKKSRKK